MALRFASSFIVFVLVDNIPFIFDEYYKKKPTGGKKS